MSEQQQVVVSVLLAMLCSWGGTVLQADSNPTSPPDAAALHYSTAPHYAVSEQEEQLPPVVVSVELLRAKCFLEATGCACWPTRGLI